MTSCWIISVLSLLCFNSSSLSTPHGKRAVPIPRLPQTVTNTTNKSSKGPFSNDNVNPTICPLGHLPQRNGSQTVCCRPVLCGPGFEIHTCQVNGSQDKCVQCKDGFLQVNDISSFNMKESSCFEDPYLGRRGGCSIEDHKVSRTQPGNCAMFCECRTEDCYVGNPCGCHEVKKCGINHQLNKDTEVCEPCPEYSFKTHKGCGRCTYNLTAFSHGITIPSTTTTQSTTDVTKFTIVGIERETKSSESENGEKDDSRNMLQTLIIITLVVLFAITMVGVGIVIRCFWKRRNCLTKRLCPPEQDQRPRPNNHQGFIEEQRQENPLCNEEEPLMMALKDGAPAVDSKGRQPDSGYSSNEAGHFDSSKNDEKGFETAVKAERILYTSFNSGCNSKPNNEAPGGSDENIETVRDYVSLDEPFVYSGDTLFSGFSKDSLLSSAESFKKDEASGKNEKISSKIQTLSAETSSLLYDNEERDTSVKDIVSADVQSLEAICSSTVAAAKAWQQVADKSTDVQRSLPYAADGKKEYKKERQVAKVEPMRHFNTQPNSNHSIQSNSFASTITSYGLGHMSVERDRDFSGESSNEDTHCDRRQPEGNSLRTVEDTDLKEIMPSENTVPKSVDGDIVNNPVNENEINSDHDFEMEEAASEITKEKVSNKSADDTVEKLAFSNEIPCDEVLCNDSNESELKTNIVDSLESKTDSSFGVTLPSNNSSVEIPMQSINSNPASVEIPLLYEREMGDGAYSIELELMGQNNDLSRGNNNHRSPETN